MNVLGHENVGPKVKLQLCTGLVDRIGQPLTGSLSFQECIAPEARKGQFMGVAWLIINWTTIWTQTPIHVVLTSLNTKSILPKRENGWPGLSLRSPGGSQRS